MTQGFKQHENIDYRLIYSSVVKSSTIRIVLSLAVNRSYKLRQLNVKNAFLQGELLETIFISQPPGFQDSKNPEVVCHLNKAIYGLKQTLKAWYLRLSNFLILNDFQNRQADTSLFIYNKNNILIWVIVYVDDHLIITENNSDKVETFIKHLSNDFRCRDLGILKFFLGMEVIHKYDGLLDMNQSRRYALNILGKNNMLNCKPCKCPVWLYSQVQDCQEMRVP